MSERNFGYRQQSTNRTKDIGAPVVIDGVDDALLFVTEESEASLGAVGRKSQRLEERGKGH